MICRQMMKYEQCKEIGSVKSQLWHLKDCQRYSVQCIVLVTTARRVELSLSQSSSQLHLSMERWRRNTWNSWGDK